MSKKKYEIINIRGCNASGKSWIILQLIKETKAKPIYDTPKDGRLIGPIIGYVGKYENTPIYFVGSYEMMSGGADYVMKHLGGIETVDNLVRRFSKKGHVVFEGFIVSGLFSRYYNLSQELGGITFCYMDTPLDICYQRIKDRNSKKTATSGRIRKSIGTRHIEAKFIETNRTRDKFLEKGEKTVNVNYRRPMYSIYKALKGEDPDV